MLRPVALPQTTQPSHRNERRRDAVPPPPETAVNIVIGRIDIRAQVTPTPAPPARARVSAPGPQPLTDYLKQRDTAR
ncbi:hypothetical protein MZO42_19560 [Sphingomonas psychrotolerans]|uniref:Uncharacterized protein n=1 Tax=Sphingomonas psychrotolerans TaxID=1327635 RepID=A0ABU3N8R5_9SPHN|nr:hypothetical protein [Sphingomonas psychrotolerans]MDT8760903.1 hypothetical protein [Sphingomonas psychrotolerans]